MRFSVYTAMDDLTEKCQCCLNYRPVAVRRTVFIILVMFLIFTPSGCISWKSWFREDRLSRSIHNTDSFLFLDFNCSSFDLQCSPCGAGSFANLTNKDCACCDVNGDCAKKKLCIECSEGEYQPGQGQTECLLCPNGTISNTTASKKCMPCAKGTAQPLEGETVCEECEVGHFSNKTGLLNCFACPNGTYSNTTASHNCTKCPPGRYQPDKAATGCEICEPGSAALSPGSLRCEICEAGTFSNKSGSTFCSPCPPGKITANPGMVNCTNCPIGHFQPSAGLSQCMECMQGSYCNHTGCTVCEECAAGMEAKHSGANNCTFCEPGYSKPLASNSLCAQCNQGWYQTKSGQLACIECPEGFYCTCFSCEPVPCPPEAFCPRGSYVPKYVTCSPLFYKKSNSCVPTTWFYVVISVAIALCLLFIALLVVRYQARRRYFYHRVEEYDRLVSYNRSTEEPVYQGF